MKRPDMSDLATLPEDFFKPIDLREVVREELAAVLAPLLAPALAQEGRGAPTPAPEAPSGHMSAHEAAQHIGWTYHVFRREKAFDAANVAPQGHRKRYRVSTLDRVAANLKK